jgi:hypothetical protein
MGAREHRFDESSVAQLPLPFALTRCGPARVIFRDVHRLAECCVAGSSGVGLNDPDMEGGSNATDATGSCPGDWPTYRDL